MSTNDMSPEDALANSQYEPDAEEVDYLETAEEELPQLGEDTGSSDLSVEDLIQDGALPEDLEHGNMGRREYEADLSDPAHEDTIDERIRQEEPEEGSAIVPEQLSENDPQGPFGAL